MVVDLNLLCKLSLNYHSIAMGSCCGGCTAAMPSCDLCHLSHLYMEQEMFDCSSFALGCTHGGLLGT